MTWHEQSWVEKHSPYDGGAYATHLIIAGIVNPDHEFELYVHPEKLAQRCHTSPSTLRRQLAKMVSDGYLEKTGAAGGRGNFNTYRFLKPDHIEQVSETHPTDPGNPPKASAETHSTATSHLLLTKDESKGTKSGATGTAVAVQTEAQQTFADELCLILAEHIAAFAGQPLPKITETWRKDMRLLIERGPLHREHAGPMDPPVIARAIEFTFRYLSVPERAGGFCWAAQIRSPGALRDHWDQIGAVARQRDRAERDPLDATR